MLNALNSGLIAALILGAALLVVREEARFDRETLAEIAAVATITR